jgi:hypothetical protein
MNAGINAKNRYFGVVFAIIATTAGRNVTEIELKLPINTFSDHAWRHQDRFIFTRVIVELILISEKRKFRLTQKSRLFDDVFAVIATTAGRNVTKIELGLSFYALSDRAKCHRNRFIFTRVIVGQTHKQTLCFSLELCERKRLARYARFANKIEPSIQGVVLISPKISLPFSGLGFFPLAEKVGKCSSSIGRIRI